MRERSSLRSSSRVTRRALVWIAQLIATWTVGWIFLDVIPSKGWVIFPVASFGAGVFVTARFGSSLATSPTPVNSRRLAFVATLMLGAWSYLAVLITVIIDGSASGLGIVSFMFAELFAATLAAAIGFVVLWVLLELGVRLGPLVRRWRQSSTSRGERPENRTPVR